MQTEYNHENLQASRSGQRFELKTRCIRWRAATHETAAFGRDLCLLLHFNTTGSLDFGIGIVFFPQRVQVS
jgi:hypothetical protein